MGFFSLFQHDKKKESPVPPPPPVKIEEVPPETEGGVVGHVASEEEVIEVEKVAAKVASEKGITPLTPEEKKKEEEKLKEKNPEMKDVGELNNLTEKAVQSAGALYRSVEIVHTGAIPLELVATAVVTVVDDFNKLKVELHAFQREGVNTMGDIVMRYDELMVMCDVINGMVKANADKDDVVAKLDEVIVEVQNFLLLINERCQDLQKLRKRTAQTWLATTGVASVTVGGAAAALCVLSGGAAMPVLAPLIAFGAGTTAVATASHIAFSPSLGAQIKDMERNIKDLDTMRADAGVVRHKAKGKKAMAEIVGHKPGEKKGFLGW
eukprot:TRINITY_DN357_c0_g2_i5.p1 TRINITY_DN357_c0_g2~~TRINITY_DN357_c0_g2_i5.p1  ORF type:complete len:323 (-),score=107.38 TRINITY_DN357_c0_g2_i5:1743-2711(-)